MGVTRIACKVFPFLSWRDRVTRETLRADLVAGVVSAVIVLPQGVAYATLAGMPPEYGLYGAMLPAIIGALWGSSWHLISGPTNATSLMVFATVGALAVPFTPQYVDLVLTLCLMIGVFKLALGVARLGALVNFISTTVVVGFTAGAGLLIVAAQLRNFFGIDVPQSPSFFASIAAFGTHIGETDRWTLATGVVTLVAAFASERLLPRVPSMLTAIMAGGAFAYSISALDVARVAMIGPLPSALPRTSMPELSAAVWRELAPVALALTVIGLTEAISSARAVAVRSGQRIDGNQEFIGQGLANIAGAFTSSYPTSGSFNRTAANFAAGARTPLAAVFSAFALLAILLFVRPFAAYIPLASMAAVLFIVAWQLIDFATIRTLWRTSRSEALTLTVTFIATLSIRLEAAIFVGMLVSLFVYLNRTTHPRISRVLPDSDAGLRMFPIAHDAPNCPQLDIVRIDGSLFFGAIEHIRDALDAARAQRPDVRHVLIVGSAINFVDAAGAALLAQIARDLRASGGMLHLCNLKPWVCDVLERSGQIDVIGRDNIYDTKDAAIRAIYACSNLECPPP